MDFQRFAGLSPVHCKRFVKPLWEQYPSCETDTWDALCLFLKGYAFERQGRPPDYGPAAADAIAIVKTKSRDEELKEEHVSEVWNEFRGLLSANKLNEANNPLCPKGTSYNRGSKATRKESVLEFLLRISPRGSQLNILMYAKNKLANDQLAELHGEIREINGIGPKIASLFLRDVAIYYGISCSRDRHLLQPIDIWVRRIVRELGGPVDDPNKQDAEVGRKAQRWIVEESGRASVNPEKVNQGMWYFATQIARFVLSTQEQYSQARLCRQTAFPT